MNSRLVTQIVIALVLIAGVYGVYVYVIKPAQEGSSGSLSQSTTLDPSRPQNAQSAAFLDIVVNLRSLQLDNSIFADPVFQSLQDFGVPLPPEEKGRPNPFAPLITAGVGTASAGNAAPTTANPVRR